MYNSIDSSCTIYNSTNGQFNTVTGYITYIAADAMMTTTTITTTTTEAVSTCVTGSFPSFDTDLLALWRFDNNANDDKASHNGTLKGHASFLPEGYINADLNLVSYSFSYVVAPNFMNLGSTSFTIELWIRIKSFSGTNMTLVSQTDLALRISDNGIVFTTEAQPSNGTELIAHKWYHIALAYNASLPLQQIYVNGILDSTSTISFSFLLDDLFYIGTLDGTSEYFYGEIDHLSITTRVKSAFEILRDASLVAFYPFSPAQDAALDSGPYGINGSLYWDGDAVPGVVGDAIKIENTNNYFQVKGLIPLTIVNSEFSFTLFIQLNPIQPCSLIFLSGTSNISDTYQAKPYLGIDSYGNLVAEFPPTTVLQTSASIPASQWSHVALTYSFTDNTISLYYNGILQTSKLNTLSTYKPPVTTPPLYVTLANPLGGPNGSIIEAQTCLGNYDEFYIWSRALSAAEVYAAATVS